MKKLILLIGFVFTSLLAQANVQLPAILSDHMVLQQNTTVKIWGWTTEPGEIVKISVDWDTTRYQTKAQYGKWEIAIKTPKAGGNHRMTVQGNKNEISISDILFGEVWLFSGQSNMEWGGAQELKESLDEMPNATNPELRFFYIPKSVADYPQEDVRARWVVCNPADMKNFSAIGYFFGKKLNQNLHVPMGLINSNWGGTPAEVWIPRESVEANAALVANAKKLKTYDSWSSRIAHNYNSMITPISKFTIAGVLWYQGESNVGQWDTYTDLMNSLILSWRKAFNNNFPFYFAQIAPYSGYGGVSGAKLREAQTNNLATEKTAMVVLSDLVPDLKNIHPTEKIAVANRFADIALVRQYGQQAGPILYPSYDRFAIEKNKIRVYFKHVSSELVVRGDQITHIFIAGEDKIFHPAIAKLTKNTLVVSSPEVPNPIAVRYGFENAVITNIFSKEGLPMNLFRTDNWDN